MDLNNYLLKMKKIKKYITDFYYLSIKKDIHKVNLHEWFSNDGDNTLLVEHDLNNESIVIECGGYLGHWTDQINRMYEPKIYVYEPVKNYFDTLQNRFKDIKNVNIYNLGLSSRTFESKIYLNNDGSSVLRKSSNCEIIKLIDIVDILSLKEFQKIDLIQINIEGSEYDLIERIIDYGLIRNIKKIQVQFHNFVDNAENRRKIIQTRLKNTHKLIWDYPFIWELWEII